MTFSSAFGVISFFLELTKSPLKPRYDNELAKILINISHCLNPKEKIYLTKTKEIYRLITKLRDYSDEKFEDLLMNESNVLARFTYLAYYSKDHGSNERY